MSKRAIPGVPKELDKRALFDQAIKENLEIIMGRREARIEPLKTTATQDEIIQKINHILDRLQG
jgi:hypothetical protein